MNGFEGRVIAVNVRDDCDPHLPTRRTSLLRFQNGGFVADYYEPVAVLNHPIQLKQHEAEALRALPGPDYYSALRWIHEALKPETYIEIGVRAGASLALASPATKCVGIDPAPQISVQLQPRTDIYRLTSDAFFATYTAQETIGKSAFDFAFIDGLHLFEQVLRDFINLERWAGARSIVAIHDCLPLNAITSQRERVTDFYSGDSWKAVWCLKKLRPDLKMVTISAPPTGLCLVAGLDADSEVLPSRYEDAVKELMELDFATYSKDPEMMPARASNTRETVSQFISGD